MGAPERCLTQVLSDHNFKCYSRLEIVAKVKGSSLFGLFVSSQKNKLARWFVPGKHFQLRLIFVIEVEMAWHGQSLLSYEGLVVSDEEKVVYGAGTWRQCYKLFFLVADNEAK